MTVVLMEGFTLAYGTAHFFPLQETIQAARRWRSKLTWGLRLKPGLLYW
jgi:hypothetical protein